MACAGDPAETCGGAWANSVYSVAGAARDGVDKPTGGTGDGTVDPGGNLARGRPASQSSTSQWSHAEDPQGAVDGAITGGFGFHTNAEANSWWQVDLGTFLPVGEVRVFNRLDCCGERALSLPAPRDSSACSSAPATTSTSTRWRSTRQTN